MKIILKTKQTHKTKQTCIACRKKREWRKYLMWQIFSFTMTSQDREEFYRKYGKCLDCAWYLAEQEEKEQKRGELYGRE